MKGVHLHSSASTSSLSRTSSRESLHEGTLSSDAAQTTRSRRTTVASSLDLETPSAPRTRRATPDCVDLESARKALTQRELQTSGSDEAASRDGEPPSEREREREPQSTAVRVVVRFRPPMNTLDDPRDSRSAHRAKRADDSCSGFIVDTMKNIVESCDLQHRFTFDRAFDQNLTQEECYVDVGMPIVADVLQGYHGTILAYGQTGSGKTYCMFGTPSPPDKQGLVPRAAHQVFDHVGAGSRAGIKFFIECTFFEVYCEQMRDLLKPGNGRLQIKEMPQKGFCVEGLTYKAVSSTNEVLQVLRAGLKQRAAGITRLNQHSSRSHAIFTLHVQQHSSAGTEKHGKLTLVDLAGSEKVHKSGSAGDMLEEAKKINSSLSTLGHVIDALADRRPHVPYRDSRLTRILEDSLGGNCRTTLLVTCSPNSVHSIETLSSLRFAARAKRVCNYVRVNVTYAADRQLFNRITQLRRELAKAHRELEQRFDGRRKDLNSGDRRVPMSPASRHRSLALLQSLQSFNEDTSASTPIKRRQDLTIDTYPHHRRGSLDKSASASSIGSAAVSRMPILREASSIGSAQAAAGASREDDEQNARTVAGASREDGDVGSKANEEANLLSPKSPFRRASPEISPMSPFRSISDAASTAAASASAASFGAVHVGSTCDTPLSSSWDKWDMIDGAGSMIGRWDDDFNAANHTRSASALPSCSVEADSASPHEQGLDDEDEVNLADVHSQEDLQWKLELERHRCAVLAMELRNRTRESKDLRRQLEETQVYRQFQPLLVTLGIPFLPAHPAYASHAPPAGPVSMSTVGSMPVLPPMTPVQVQEVRTCHDVAPVQNLLHFSASTSQLGSASLSVHTSSASQLHTASASTLHRASTPSISSPHRHRQQLSSSVSNEHLGSDVSNTANRSISANRSPQPQRQLSSTSRLGSSISTEHLGSSISVRSPSPGSRLFVRYSAGLRHAGSPPAKFVSTSPRPSSTCRTQLRRSGSLQTTLHAAPPSRMVSVGSAVGSTGSLTTRESTGNLSGASAVQTALSSRQGSLSARAGPPTLMPPTVGPVFNKSASGPCAPAPLQPPVPMVPGGAADCTLAELRSELQRWVNSSVSTGGIGHAS